MKLIFELNGKRETKCYFLDESGKKEFVDFWHIKVDMCGVESEFNSWKSQNIRKKNYAKLKQMRRE